MCFVVSFVGKWKAELVVRCGVMVASGCSQELAMLRKSVCGGGGGDEVFQEKEVTSIPEFQCGAETPSHKRSLASFHSEIL